MSSKKSIKATKIIISQVALLVGGLIYVTFRSNHLLMFKWFECLNISPFIVDIRNNYGGFGIYEWVEYNLPAALWLFSYMYLIDAIWGETKDTKRKMFFVWILPLLALMSEFMQLVDILPGTFDVFDLVGYLLAILTYVLIKKGVIWKKLKSFCRS